MTGILQIANQTFDFSDVTVRFSSSDFLPKRRQESYSDFEVLSAIGGTLGLFLGASVISVIEIVFYFSFKILKAVFTIFLISAYKKIIKK